MKHTLKLLSLSVILLLLTSCGETSTNLPGPVLGPDSHLSTTYEITRPNHITEQSSIQHYPMSGESEFRTFNLHGQTINYIVTEGKAVVGGDVVYSSVEAFEQHLYELSQASPSDLSAQGFGFNASFPRNWPDGIVYYEITSSAAGLSTLINNALFYWQAYTPLRFVQSTTANDRVEFRGISTPQGGGGAGCYVVNDGTDPTTFLPGTGHSTFRQYVMLSPNCTLTTIMHEIGHVVGLIHEHQRCDRHRHINIAPIADTTLSGVAGQIIYNSNLYDRHCNNASTPADEHVRYLGPYDGLSIMHYFDTAFGATPHGSSQPNVVLKSINPATTLHTNASWWMSLGDVNSILRKQRVPGVCNPITNTRCTYLGDIIWSNSNAYYSHIIPTKTGTHTAWLRAEYEDMYLSIWRQEPDASWTLQTWVQVPADSIGLVNLALDAGTQYAWGAERVVPNTGQSVTFDLFTQVP